MANNLRCLTIHQPWASAIAVGPKRIENRGVHPPFGLIGNMLGIHAGKRVDGDGLIACRELGFEIDPDAMPIGGIIAVARVDGWVTSRDFTLAGGPQSHERIAGLRQDPWFNPQPWNVGWVLSDVVALPTPVPCRGMQDVWWPTDGVVRNIFEQLEAAKAVGNA